MRPREIALRCAKIAHAKKAGAIKVLDVAKLTTVCRYFVVLSGRSEVHVRTFADAIERYFKKENIYPLHKEGGRPGRWIVLDYGGVVVHMFQKNVREFYKIEKFWADAKQVSWLKTKRAKK